jgi:hypothetical protein
VIPNRGDEVGDGFLELLRPARQKANHKKPGIRRERERERERGAFNLQFNLAADHRSRRICRSKSEQVKWMG